MEEEIEVQMERWRKGGGKTEERWRKGTCRFGDKDVALPLVIARTVIVN